MSIYTSCFWKRDCTRRKQPHYEQLRLLRHSMLLKPDTIRTAELVCREYYMSQRYFQNLYKKYFGESYHHSCIFCKAHYAKFLLSSTQLSVSAIASACGYDVEKHFMTLFRRYTGMTMTGYRKIMNEVL